MVLALLGDNPMQSEFACHIGLGGKYFCRACWVKGSDALDRMPIDEALDPGGTDTGHGSDHDSDGGQSSDAESVGSAASDLESVLRPPPAVSPIAGSSDGATGVTPASPVTKPKKGKGKKVVETMAEMVKRVKSFLTVFLSQFPHVVKLKVNIDWSSTEQKRNHRQVGLIFHGSIFDRH